jgi:sugar/nucleoside kinase (ribokinase family)
MEEYPVKVLPKEKIVDMIGSGDAFFGGFIAAFIQVFVHLEE